MIASILCHLILIVLAIALGGPMGLVIYVLGAIAGFVIALEVEARKMDRGRTA